MFERFTEGAREVVVCAGEEARGLRHDFIGASHLLLGLLREEEGVAAQVLGDAGLTAESVRGQIVEIAGYGDRTPMRKLPFTRRAKKTLELALRESLRAGRNQVETEHILLGLTEVQSDIVTGVLAGHGLDTGKVRATVQERLERAVAPASADARHDDPDFDRRVAEFEVELLDAQLRAVDSRDAVVDAVFVSPTRDEAATRLMALLEVGRSAAEAILAAPLGVWTQDELASIRSELADLRTRLEAHDA
jgi:ATP-dependent Clp protease ATP-binding subunit ClpA